MLFFFYQHNYRDVLVGRGLGTTITPSLDTPPSSPSLNLVETKFDDELTNTNKDYSSPKTSLNSSQSRVSAPEDDLRLSNSQMNSVTYIGGVTTRQTNSTIPHPSSASLTNGAAFKMMSISGNICPRCSKAVYSAEEVKAAGKVKENILSLASIDHCIDFSHFINDVILVLIVKRVSMLLDIPNMKENYTITVRCSIMYVHFYFCGIFRLLSTFIWSKRYWIRNIVNRKLTSNLKLYFTGAMMNDPLLFITIIF